MDARKTPLGSLFVSIAMIVAIAPAHELLGGIPIGPDVITDRLGPALIRYPNVGSTAAYAMDTVSCNRGDADAIWITDGPQPNRHPLISQNMYRLKTVAGATRFEQIGMSWLKHGFCAADEAFPSCGTCVPDESCDWLTPGCSDTYSASLNGTQSILGPRSDVNASTGVYPYPFTFYPIPANIGRRLQINNNDLDPAQNAGAQYIAEVHYLTSDEPAWNTHYNNASWRPVAVTTFSAGGWNLSFLDVTHQQEAAIQAWPQWDSGVTLVDVYIDGRLILGYKVTPLVGGTWHYEYSIYNMNSDRSVQQVHIPLHTGTTITNEGFHDVDYHSNEIYSSVDWAIDWDDSEIFWYTGTYAANVNSNALRWGTTYSYRFDADRPPEPGVMTLDLFKPGTPSSIQVAVAVPSVPCACPGDVNASGTVNGEDVSGFVSAYLGGPFSPCADLASPIGAALDNSDLDAFVSAVLTGAACP